LAGKKPTERAAAAQRSSKPAPGGRATRRERFSPWDFARALKEARQDKRVTLEELAAQTKLFDPTGIGVSAAHLSRIERRKAEPSLSELYLITRTLGISARDLLVEDAWFVVRRASYESELQDIIDGTKQNAQSREAHSLMVSSGVYRYAPLSAENAGNEKHGAWRPIMEAYVFDVDKATDDLIQNGLDKHDGEEIVHVIQGRLELHFEYLNGEREIVTLDQGDTIQYTSRICHAYRSVSPNTRTRAVFVYAWRGESKPERGINTTARSVRRLRSNSK
jgi:transcriptional regulator with XRE-family HTH domain